MAGLNNAVLADYVGRNIEQLDPQGVQAVTPLKQVTIERDAMTQELEAMKAKMANMAAELEALKAERTVLRDTLSDTEFERFSLELKTRVLEGDKGNLTRERNEAQERVAGLLEENGGLALQVAELTQANRDKDTKLADAGILSMKLMTQLIQTGGASDAQIAAVLDPNNEEKIHVADIDAALAALDAEPETQMAEAEEPVVSVQEPVTVMQAIATPPGALTTNVIDAATIETQVEALKLDTEDGKDVARLQGMLAAVLGQDVTVDGQMGKQTRAALLAVDEGTLAKLSAQDQDVFVAALGEVSDIRFGSKANKQVAAIADGLIERIELAQDDSVDVAALENFVVPRMMSPEMQLARM